MTTPTTLNKPNAKKASVRKRAILDGYSPKPARPITKGLYLVASTPDPKTPVPTPKPPQPREKPKKKK